MHTLLINATERNRFLPSSRICETVTSLRNPATWDIPGCTGREKPVLLLP